MSKLPTMIAQTPNPPYYAVIFVSVKADNDDGYKEMAELMMSLAKEQDGFLGVESARNDIGITISYWKDLASIKNWKAHTDHQVAQKKGRSDWYRQYKTRICLVERDYGYEQ